MAGVEFFQLLKKMTERADSATVTHPAFVAEATSAE
jgi:hypothetical protein